MPNVSPVYKDVLADPKLMTHPFFQTKKDTIMNGGFASQLDDYISYRPQIKVWLHGHTHDDFDYMIDHCRVVCNPRGYTGHEARADSFKLKYIDL